MKPVVSIVMSVFNGGLFLSKAIESIQAQTYKHIELIIIDDSSTDRTPHILKKYAEQDSRIVLIRNKNNLGLTKSLNKGCKISKGEFIARQDADDFSHPERIAKQVDFMSCNPDVMLLGTGAYLIDEVGKILRNEQVVTGRERLKKMLTKGNKFIHGSVMIRKSCLSKVGPYREEFRSGQDYDLFLRIAERFAVNNLGESLYFYRIHEEAISESRAFEQETAAMVARTVSALRRKGLAAEWTPELYKQIYDTLRYGTISKRVINRNVNLTKGRNLLLKGAVREARAIFWKAFVSIPSFRTSCHLLKSYTYSASN